MIYSTLTEMLATISTVTLGLFAGGLALEGLVLVPYWRTLSPNEFFALHRQFGKRLYAYFAPLTTAAVVLSIIAAAVDRKSIARWICAALAMSVLMSFPLFFQKANLAFETRSIPDHNLPAALKKWSNVHTARTFVAIAALIASVTAFIS